MYTPLSKPFFLASILTQSCGPPLISLVIFLSLLFPFQPLTAGMSQGFVPGPF